MKAENQKETKTKKTTKNSNIFRGVGRRKQSVARVWLKLEKGPILVNDKPVDDYFAHLTNKKYIEEPFRVINRVGQMSGTIKVVGGGSASQAAAVVHGISRALVEFDETFRLPLAKRKLLTRDSRVKERRKYGFAGKARARKQSPKR